MYKPLYDPLPQEDDFNHRTNNGEAWWLERDEETKEVRVYSFKGGPLVVQFITDMGTPELVSVQEIVTELGRSGYGISYKEV